MVGTTARATALGAAGAVLTGAAGVWLVHSAASAWPAAGPVPVGTGLGVLATGAAGLVAAWAAVLLAGATASLALSARRVHGRAFGAASPGAGGGLTGRVAAALLVVASLGAAPATAADAPRPLAAVVSPDPVTPSGAPGASGPAWGSTAGEEEPDVPGAVDEVPVPGWTPTASHPDPVGRATAEVGLVSTTSSTAQETIPERVVVHRGDTLWDIAARHLGEHATDQDVAEAWPLWYAANRDVIGDDPDLIHPGQRLVVPTSGSAR